MNKPVTGTILLPPTCKISFLKKLNGYIGMTLKTGAKYLTDYMQCFHLLWLPFLVLLKLAFLLSPQ